MHKRFLECILVRAIEEPGKEGVLMNLILTNKEELDRGMKVEGSLGCRECERKKES